MCEALGIPLVAWSEDPERCRRLLAGADWVFDGVAGTGIRGPLRADAARLVDAMNSSPGRRVAIDVPSGVREGFRPGDPAVRAELTLTMGLPKTCLYLPHARELCGRILVVHVGFPPALVEDPAIPGETLDEGAWKGLLRQIPQCAHKGTRGHLAVFAGSVGTSGAAWLCATAAARSRVGLVSLFLDAAVHPLLAPRLASVMAKPWDPAAAARKGGFPAFDPSRYDALLVGPGWGTGQDREPWVTLLASSGLPGVIDADGLTLLGRLRAAGKCPALGGRWVLTPHPGEFARLTGVPLEDVLADPLQHALRAAGELDAVVVLKGACTHVADPHGKYWILDGCNPALATGGSGDVLAGIVAGAMAGGLAAREAALFGVSLHAHVGDLARRRRGWFLAEDLLPFLSSALGGQPR
jgi:ADP-dependent NAD(P)H-hydrate dehydratase / NAD(P)H-hydrate epimerase